MKIHSNSCSITLITCFLAVMTICFTGIHGHEVWTPDEPRVASISLEMANTGNYIIPQLAGKPFIEKPPLYFLSAAFMLKLFDSQTNKTTVIRLTTVLFGLGVLYITFLLSKRLWGFRAGVTTVFILATMVGFVENFHWIRVDAALAFFVIGAVWCFVEIYFEQRLKFLPLAGLFLAGSFLSKGVIGPVLIAVPWFGIAALHIFSLNTINFRNKGFAGYHILAIFIFIITSGLWISLLYWKGGESLWNEWFWVNQVGRLTGASVSKGHIKPGQPFYYTIQLLIYGIPWSPLILYWFGKITASLIKRRPVSKEMLFIYLWGFGAIVLLSIPATKRGIYLAPVFPAYALMATAGIKDLTPKWFHSYAGLWTILCIALMSLVTCLPFLAFAIPKSVPPGIKEFITHFSYYHIIACVFVALSLTVTLRYRKRFSIEAQMVLITAALYITLLGLPIQALDLTKRMDKNIQHFVSQIPQSKRDRIAGTGFSETTLGAFYFYANWPVPQIADSNRIQQILSGKDSQYNSLIINKRGKELNKDDIPNADYRIIFKSTIGRDRRIYWLEGISS